MTYETIFNTVVFNLASYLSMTLKVTRTREVH
jgi:hypothetical protein